MAASKPVPAFSSGGSSGGPGTTVHATQEALDTANKLISEIEAAQSLNVSIGSQLQSINDAEGWQGLIAHQFRMIWAQDYVNASGTYKQQLDNLHQNAQNAKNVIQNILNAGSN